jgi:4-hydroxy-4-methyl-2-oxoglutarate aldolase
MPSPLTALETFDWTTPVIADACARLELPVRQGPPGMMALRPEARLAGRVAPAVHAGSPDVVLEAIAGAAWGDVLIVDNNGRLDEACVGDLLAGEALASGLAGIVIDGAHRGSAAIRAVGIPLWSRGRAAAGPRELRRRHATALEAATCGPSTVTREDAVFADEDGVVFVVLGECARVIEAARAIAMHERAQAARIEGGQPLRDQLALSDYLARRESEPEYTFRKHVQRLLA